jgi:hypothetical protein
MSGYWEDQIANNFQTITREDRQDTTPGAFSKIGAVWTAATHNDVTDALGDYLGKPAANVASEGLAALDYPVHMVKRGASAFTQVNPILGNDGLFDSSQWSQAWKRSEDLSFGEAAVIGYKNLFNIGPKWGDGSDPYDESSQAEAKDFYHNTWSGKMLSGVLDASLYAADPTIVAGAGLKGLKVARTTIGKEAVAGAVAKSTGATTEATGRLAKSEAKGALRLQELYRKTDGLSASQMAQLPEFKESGDAGAIASFFERANRDFKTDQAARHQAKADIIGTILGDAKSIDNIKALGDEMAHNIYRMGEPPASSDALKLYSQSDFGAAMLKAWNEPGYGGTGFNSAAILRLTDEHEKEFSRLQDLLQLAGSSDRVASTQTEKLGTLIRQSRVGEALVPTGLGGRPMRFLLATTASRIPGSVHIKDASRGLDDLTAVTSKMKNTSAARKQEIADQWVKAATAHDRRKVVDTLDAQIYDDAAKKYGISKDAAELFVKVAGGRRNAYTQAMKDRLYSTAPTEKLVQVVDPEDDLSHVYDKAFLSTHIEDTHAITDPKMVDDVLRSATNRRMLERLTEATRFQSTATAAHDLNDAFIESAGHWLTMATRAWKDTALMRLAYPVRIQVDTQMRLLSHLGMLQYMANLKSVTANGVVKYALENKDGEKNLADFVKGGIFREGDRAGAIAKQQMKGKPYAGIDIRPARNDEELQKIDAAIGSTGGAAADIANDISARTLREMRAEGSYGKVKPDDPEWFQAWKRAADQIRTSPTARFATTEDDPAVIKAFVNKDPAARKEWLEFKAQSDSQDEWIARVQGHVNQYLPSPELKKLIASPEKARDLFDIGGSAKRAAQVGPAYADRKAKETAAKDAFIKTKKLKQDWEATPPRSPERKEALRVLREARAELKEIREARTEAQAVHAGLKVNPFEGRQIANPDEAVVGGGIGSKVVPMTVHGESFSPLTKSSIGDRIDKIRKGWYDWAADVPETIMGRSPLYAHSFRSNMRDAIDRLGPEGIDKIGVEALRKTADRKARQEVANILFDSSHSSTMSHSMRFLSPFFSAWEDTAKKWSKLIGSEPQQLGYLAQAWDAPNGAGIVVDSEGNHVGRDGKTRDSEGNIITDPKYRGRGQSIILPGAPGLSKLASGGGFKINKQSANILFQGNPPWLPGVGPLVSIPTNKLAAEMWPDMVDNPVMRYFLPFGLTDDSTRRQLEPSWWKQAEDALFNTKDNAQIYAMLMAQERGRKERGERKTDPTHDEIKGKTRNWFLLRAALNNAAPVSIQPTPKDQMYIDKAHEYQNDKKRKDWQADFYNDFPGYFGATMNLSVNNTGIEASNAAYRATQKYRKDIESDPEHGWFFVGTENLTGEWSSDINVWQRANEAGQGKKFRGASNPQLGAAQALEKNQEQEGWVQYSQMATAVDLELKKRGLTNIQQKGAEDLADMKKQYVQYLGTENSAWYSAFNKRDSSGVQDLVTLAQKKWDSDPDFANRPDQKSLRSYLEARDAIKAQLDARPEHGIGNDSNADLAYLWDEYRAYLVDNSPGFEQIYNRVLESDDISRDLLPWQTASPNGSRTRTVAQAAKTPPKLTVDLAPDPTVP